MTDDKAASDNGLVREFLALTGDYSGQEIAVMVPGITDNDVSRWRRGDWKRLSAAKRRAVKEFVEMRQRTGPGFWPPPADPAAGSGGSLVQAVREKLEGGSADPNSPEHQLVEMLGLPDALRRMAGKVPPEDLVAAAMQLAVDEGWPEDRRDRLAKLCFDYLQRAKDRG